MQGSRDNFFVSGTELGYGWTCVLVCGDAALRNHRSLLTREVLQQFLCILPLPHLHRRLVTAVFLGDRRIETNCTIANNANERPVVEDSKTCVAMSSVFVRGHRIDCQCDETIEPERSIRQ